MTISAVLVMLLGALAATLAVRGLEQREQRSAMLAFAAHCLCSVAQWAVVEFYYGVSDVHIYQNEGAQLARLLDVDFVHFAPEVLRLAFHLETKLPFQAWGDGSSTGTMSAVAGIFGYVAEPSPVTLYAITSCFSWFGCLCWYRVAREELNSSDRRVALLGIFWVPSVIFWTSGFVKEALVMGFMGVLGLSTHRLLRGSRLPSVLGIAFGGAGVAMLKPFTLFAFFLATAAFVYARRVSARQDVVRVKPIYVVAALVIGVGGVVAMGALFPEYSAGQLSETMAQTQESWRVGAMAGYGGGSSIEMGSGEATTVAGQAKFVPLALVTALFRPTLLEARNPPSLAGALENTLLLVAIVSLLTKGARKPVRDAILYTPFILASVVFVLVFGTGVSLATSNLGALSRYRITMMPFYATTVMVLLGRARVAAFARRRPALVRPRRAKTALTS